ncbi:MAG: HlyD family efflux transporter periplasmic adaptor subunit, partial [Gemmataceae bacterium]|nr:HlyD family efflux transporter periplasmic adaptor subunit [Gemmataceae bacterium]
MRLFFWCLVVAGACVAAVMYLGNGWEPKAAGKPPTTYPASFAPPPEGTGSEPGAAKPNVPTDDDKEIVPVVLTGGKAAPLTIQEGRILPVLRQEVPSLRDGNLLFLATPIKPGERIDDKKKIVWRMSTLAVPVTQREWEDLKHEERIALDEPVAGRFYRRIRATDPLDPRTTVLVRERMELKPLELGDKVQEGQILGLVNPALSIAEVSTKYNEILVAQAEVRVSQASMEESRHRLAGIRETLRINPKAIPRDDVGVAEVTVKKYTEEVVQKKAGVDVAQEKLSAANTTLNLHFVRANIDGIVRATYKQPGESVKNMESVLQIQGRDKLRVEAQVEVQDALLLRGRMAKAEALRAEAMRQRLEAWRAGRRLESLTIAGLEKQADDLTRVEVEAARQEPPLAAVLGHRDEVTCVAVLGDRVVSGSEDHTVRLWSRVAGEDRLEEKTQLDHSAPVRCVAVSGAGEKKRLATGTSTGRVRLFDLDDLEKGQKLLASKHSGPVNALSFSHDGKHLVTAGEDASLCLWNAESGELLGRVANAHAAAVTSALFTAKGQVVTAGRDKRLVVWDLAEGGEGGKTLKQDAKTRPLERRSGDVAGLGVDPTGEQVLFDEGRELRVLNLATRRIVGTLRNPVGTPNFAHFAWFSPDGNSVLAGGNGAGRLQLWRAPGEGMRPAEMRQYLWSGTVTCAAFDAAGQFAVTGT